MYYKLVHHLLQIWVSLQRNGQSIPFAKAFGNTFGDYISTTIYIRVNQSTVHSMKYTIPRFILLAQ